MGVLNQNIEVGHRYRHTQKGMATIESVAGGPYTTVRVRYDDEQYGQEDWSLGDFYIKFQGPDQMHIFTQGIKQHRRKNRH